MDIKLPDIKNLKKLEKGIGSSLKKHTFLTWMFLGFMLLLFAGYIFYFTVYFAISANPSPDIVLPSIQKSQLDKILIDMDRKKQSEIEFKSKTHINPFEISH